MSKEGVAKKNIFEQIFKEGWEAFGARHPRYEAADEVIQVETIKGMLMRGLGYIRYQILRQMT
jgi:hypothetical protein